MHTGRQIRPVNYLYRAEEQLDLSILHCSECLASTAQRMYQRMIHVRHAAGNTEILTAILRHLCVDQTASKHTIVATRKSFMYRTNLAINPLVHFEFANGSAVRSQDTKTAQRRLIAGKAID